MSAAPKQEAELIRPYDSLSNIKPNYELPTDAQFKHLIGQKLLYLGSDKTNDNYHSDFYNETKKDYVKNSKMIGHYFTIIDIKSKDQFSVKMDGDTTSVYLLKIDLLGKDRNKECVIVGYYEKMREKYENKDLVFIEDDYDYNEYDGLINSTTRKRNYNIDGHSIWHCSQVSVFQEEDPYRKIKGNRVVLILENEKYGQHFTFAENGSSYHSSWEERELKKFKLKEDYNKIQAQKKAAAALAAKKRAERKQNLINRYGQDLGTKIADGIVKVGMTKEQCKEAWGEPVNINRTTTASGTHEQWVYEGGSYLYFDGNILTTIQN